MLVRAGLTVKNIATTGFEVLDGKGLPVEIVDGASGTTTLEVMPLGCSLNLVRRTARSSFGYTRKVTVDMVPPRAPGQERRDTGSQRHLGSVEERVPVKRLADWEDLWREWSDKCGERRAAEVEWRVLKSSGVARNAERGDGERLEALEALEALVCLRANLHGVDVGMLRALNAVLDASRGDLAPTALAVAAARVVWRLAGHPDGRVTALIWDQNIVRTLALAANGAAVPPRDGDPGDAADLAAKIDAAAEGDWFAHAAACVEIKSSTRLQCERIRTVWTRLFRHASRT